MREILDEGGLNLYVKNKKYYALLQCYLHVMKITGENL